MREDESNWFSKWEDELPSPDELTPLSQTLISPNLAMAFDIQSPPNPHPQIRRPSPPDPDSSSTGADEPARTLKRPRLVWTPQLHKRFVDAVAHLGIKNAVPKTIMQLMSVDGLTRENVASHLQKYRLYLKRMQGIGAGAGDPVSDRLFASSPVPAHFLGGGYVASPAVVAGGGGFHQVGCFPAPVNGGWQFQVGGGGGRFNGHALNGNSGSVFVADFESGACGDGRRVLTLFPASE